MVMQGQLTVERSLEATVRVRIAGRWHLSGDLAVAHAVDGAIAGPPLARLLTFDTSALADWDSALAVVVGRILDRCRLSSVPADTSGLPAGLQRLLALSTAVPSQPPSAAAPKMSPLARVGVGAIERWRTALLVLSFVGELTYSLGRFVVGHARVRPRDVLAEMQIASVRSFPIVGIVSFLLGLILAFVGGVTLRQFGATLYVANVVTIAMVRELGPIMTAIVIAGRNGSAYAAQLGTMKVTQEIDALTTMALPPSDFLVLPRALALTLMMPLLVVYGDFIALGAGGLVYGTSGGSLTTYAVQVKGAITLTTFWIGFIKSIVFGVVVALCGCIAGLRASKSAAAVGEAATSAVVSAIVCIIGLDGVFALVLNVLGI
jgi:phospholipid/cholesterol/gamma-HCH transport system permease protein